MRELLREHSPHTVVVMETRVPFDSQDYFFFPGDRGSQSIHAIITRNGYEDWVFSATYGGPNLKNMESLWNNLQEFSDYNSAPWMLAWDFNDYANSSDRRGNSSNQSNNNNNNTRCKRFRENIDRCGMLDLGCTGLNLTWTNGRRGLARTFERLDRALANEAWRVNYPEAVVRNLPKIYSDHCPMLIMLSDKLKLNVDGSAKGNPGLSGYGGLIRNDQGAWVSGFMGSMGEATSPEAEIWGLYRGLQIIKEKNLKELTIEFDSTGALSLMNDLSIVQHPPRAVLEDCRHIARRMGCKFSHTRGNFCVDFLTNMGVMANEDLITLDRPLEELGIFLQSYLVGVMFTRP